MICASSLAERRGLIGRDSHRAANAAVAAIRAADRAAQNWPTDDLLATMRKDKKAVAGQLRFILPTTLGNVALFDDVPEEDVRAVLSAELAGSRFSRYSFSVRMG